MAPKELNFITGNKNKLAEVQAILAPTGVKLSNQSIDLPELQGTIEEISIAKCNQAAEVVHHAYSFYNPVNLYESTDQIQGRRASTGRRHMPLFQRL